MATPDQARYSADRQEVFHPPMSLDLPLEEDDDLLAPWRRANERFPEGRMRISLSHMTLEAIRCLNERYPLHEPPLTADVRACLKDPAMDRLTAMWKRLFDNVEDDCTPSDWLTIMGWLSAIEKGELTLIQRTEEDYRDLRNARSGIDTESGASFNTGGDAISLENDVPAECEDGGPEGTFRAATRRAMHVTFRDVHLRVAAAFLSLVPTRNAFFHDIEC